MVLQVLWVCCLFFLSEARTRTHAEHFNHSLIFEVFAMDVPQWITTKPEYKGLNTKYSFEGTPALTEATQLWGCFAGRATDLTGREIGHAECCATIKDPGLTFMFVTKLVVEDVGTLVVAMKVEPVISEISPDTVALANTWTQVGTVLPETEGSFLPYLSRGQFKKWRGYCYLDFDMQISLTAAPLSVVTSYPRVFHDCSYRKPEHQKRT
eukprot:TRINITY_DN15521_c0_g3_i2.p1 TRINITY_DN15521_c0_g3~~TRINITY_DN15521_c0_g3_i2.p1  ORF type:complete len:210 (-),score=12.61 TRINITY_DN15521_c0_g3_i2:2-631(-)